MHRRLVEDVLCGLDINQHAVQLAACNLTLGAPTVDYARMNLMTMPHGPQGNGTFKAGSLEILSAEAERLDPFSRRSLLGRPTATSTRNRSTRARRSVSRCATSTP